jgi:hypothetical protein
MHDSHARLCLSLALLTACAGPSVNHQRLTQVHSLAIIGYSVELTGITGPTTEQMSRLTNLYDDLAAVITSHLHCTVLPREAVAGAPAYMALHPADGSQVSVVSMFSGYSLAYVPTGIMTAPEARDLNRDQLRHLATDLGVDAVGIALVRVRPVSGPSINGGVEDLHFKSQVEFALYDLQDDDPIWEDGKARGGVSSTARRLGALALAIADAVKSAYAELLSRVE